MDSPFFEVDHLAGLLAENERRRAAAFKNNVARRRFVTVRGMLRLLLERYTGIPAQDLDFHYGPYGKPALVPSEPPDIAFNVSHSDEMALFAFTAGCEVGVDIQKTIVDPEQLAAIRLVLTDAELAQLDDTAADSDLSHRSTRIWVAKEAILKALGLGLGQSLSVSIADVFSSKPVITIPSSHDAISKEWQIQCLHDDPDFMGALACPSVITRFKKHAWNSTCLTNRIDRERSADKFFLKEVPF